MTCTDEEKLRDITNLLTARGISDKTREALQKERDNLLKKLINT